jgi:hypothetical protein
MDKKKFCLNNILWYMSWLENMIIQYIVSVKHDILKKKFNGLTHVIINKDKREKNTKK